VSVQKTRLRLPIAPSPAERAAFSASRAMAIEDSVAKQQTLGLLTRGFIAFQQQSVRYASSSAGMLMREKFLNGSISLVDGLIGVGSGCCVGIRDSDPPKGPASNIARALAIGPIRIP